MFCDFCASPLESTRAHCIESPDSDVLIDDAEGNRLMGIGYRGNWAACDICFSKLLNHSFDDLIDHALRGFGDLPLPFVDFWRGILQRLYSELRIVQ